MRGLPSTRQGPGESWARTIPRTECPVSSSVNLTSECRREAGALGTGMKVGWQSWGG